MNKELQQILNANKEWGNQIKPSLIPSIELISSILEPYAKMREQVLEPALQLRKALAPYEELRRTFTISHEVCQAIREISERSWQPHETFSTSVLKRVNSYIFSDAIDATRQILNEFDFSQITTEQTDSNRKMDLQLFGDKDDDYVTADESLVKEFDLTKPISIPTGNKRIKITTSDFIALLALILSILTCVKSEISASADATQVQQIIETEQERNQIEQERNEILYDFLDSVDTSNSSDSESVEFLTESVRVLYSEVLELTESLHSLRSELSDFQDTVQSDESVVPPEDCLSQLQSESHDSCSEPTDIENKFLNNESAENK